MFSGSTTTRSRKTRARPSSTSSHGNVNGKSSGSSSSSSRGSASASNSRGFFGAFSSRQKRDKSSTLLPTTYHAGSMPPTDTTHRSSAARNIFGWRKKRVKKSSSARQHASSTRGGGGGGGGMGVGAGNTSAACNSFLLGGHYYPGKDKKRVHYLRKRTLWYRCFCSTPIRRITSACIVSLLIVWLVIIPFARILLEYGQLLSSPSSSSSSSLRGIRGFGNGPGMATSSFFSQIPQKIMSHLQPIQQERIQAVQLLENMREIQYGPLQRISEKMDLFRQILEPQSGPWLSSNDYKKVTDSAGVDANTPKDVPTDDGNVVEKEGFKAKKDEEMESAEKNNVKNAKEIKENNQEIKIATKGTLKPKSKQVSGPAVHSESQSHQQVALDRVLQPIMNGTERILRTLQNLETLPSHNSCPNSMSEQKVETTLVLQATVDRVWLLEETCKRWTDPIVAVIYTHESDWNSGPYSSNNTTGWRRDCPQLTILIHTPEPNQDSSHYPVNQMRNEALDVVRTSHLLVVDIDFIPSLGLNDVIRNTIIQQEFLGRRNDDKENSGTHHRTNSTSNDANSTATSATLKDAIIVPAFERTLQEPCSTIEACRDHSRTDPHFIPLELDDLRACVMKYECIPFQQKVSWDSHYTTHSERWLKGDWYEHDDTNTTRNDTKREAVAAAATTKLAAAAAANTTTTSTWEGKRIKRVKCFDSLRYEPYVVLQWCPSPPSLSLQHKNNETSSMIERSQPSPMAPYYDERFYGYGKNKIQHISHLRYLGYQFSILPQGFLLHHPHPESHVKEVWNDVKQNDLHRQMDELYPKFLYELHTKYGEHKATPLCKRNKKGPKPKRPQHHD